MIRRALEVTFILMICMQVLPCVAFAMDDELKEEQGNSIGEVEEEGSDLLDTLSVAPADTLISQTSNDCGVISRLAIPVIITGIVGGILLLLFTERGR